MKIKRRDFLALGMGVAAGTALSPVPWKLTDDLSIWTQNWPWTPVPDRGEVAYVNSVCALCPGGCGISVRKVDNRVVKIEGRDGHPVNQGGICGLGLSGPQLLYGPSRIKSPLKRAGERGEGKWTEISWDEAIETVAEKLAQIKSEGREDALGVMASRGRGTVPSLFQKLLEACGSENYFRPASMHDTGSLVAEKVYGQAGLGVGYDVENADRILSFGCGILEGWGSPAHMFRSVNRAGLIQIEPRLSNTAAAAGRWVAARPGTERALALGIAGVIMRESLFNRRFIKEGDPAFKALKKIISREYTPEKVAVVTGLDKHVIYDLARTFARSKRPLALCGKGRGDTPGSFSEFAAVHVLNALMGNVNQKGGVRLFEKEEEVAWTPDSQFADAVNGKGGAPLSMLMVWEANPLYTLPDMDKTKEAFQRIPHIVSFASHMDETAGWSDLILPNPTYLERYEDIYVEAGDTRRITGMMRPVLEPLFETMHTGEALIRMAQKAGGGLASAFEWDNYAACLEESMGDAWETLTEEGFKVQEATPLSLEKGIFASAETDFGSIAGAGVSAEIEGGNGKFPLTLVPKDSMRLASGHVADPPFMVKIVEDTVLSGGDSVVELNPRTAKKYGLKEGSLAKLTTPRGSVKVKVTLFDGIMPGLVAMPRGLGHDGYDAFVSGKGANYNTISGVVRDSVSGFNGAWGIRAELARV